MFSCCNVLWRMLSLVPSRLRNLHLKSLPCQEPLAGTLLAEAEEHERRAWEVPGGQISADLRSHRTSWINCVQRKEACVAFGCSCRLLRKASEEAGISNG